MKPLKIWFWRQIIKHLIKEYGCDCPDRDDNVLEEGGCASCKAKFVVDFIKNHIEMFD